MLTKSLVRPDLAAGREIYVEFIIKGNVVKATAIDSVTGLEASIVGPAGAPQSVLAEAARRKLEYVAKKKS
jgi:hypothetical protein